MNKVQEIKISGKVIRGDGYGRKLGFPTANLDRREYKRERMKIRFGVWAGYVKIQKSYKAGIVIGPVDKSGLPKIEAHLLNFKGNLYGKKVAFTLKKYLRPFKKYNTIAGLKQQIRSDLKKIAELHD